jgi:hypothetical protein
MTEWHIEPPDFPTAAHCRDAIQKGLGRALRWAERGVWKDREVLLEACLTDFRYDRQCEDARGPWLWRMMQAVRVIEAFRLPLLNAVEKIHDGLAAVQLCQFYVRYARQGDERFRRQLRRIVAEKPDPSCPWLGEQELIELEGEAGFLFVAKIRGAGLLEREWDWDWDDKALIDAAIDQLGTPKILDALQSASASSKEIDCFQKNWRAAVEKEGGVPKQNHANRMREYTLDDVIRAAEGARNQAGLLRGWGMYASEGDLEMILERLLACREPEWIANYLRVFSNRALPRFDERMLGLLDHEDEKVRGWAYRAVGQNAHPAVREFVIGRLYLQLIDPEYLHLFMRNFQPGDEVLILETLSIPDDADQRHGLLMDVVKVLEQNPAARCETLALLAYRLTPCGSCRFHAVKLLVDRNVAPAWLIAECGYDAVSDTRELVEQLS